jgi:prephenate dehydrogenase
MIAFTSQMPHIVSNAFIKSPTALEHRGFSAGSYRDLTRVAWLNPGMWAELFLENREFVLKELDTLLASLTAYRDALEEENKEVLMALLTEGKERKELVDG